jgi:hypothetical protein
VDKTIKQKAQAFIEEQQAIPGKLSGYLVPNTVGNAVLDLLSSGSELTFESLTAHLQSEFENPRNAQIATIYQRALDHLQALAD